MLIIFCHLPTKLIITSTLQLGKTASSKYTAHVIETHFLKISQPPTQKPKIPKRQILVPLFFYAFTNEGDILQYAHWTLLLVWPLKCLLSLMCFILTGCQSCIKMKCAILKSLENRNEFIQQRLSKVRKTCRIRLRTEVSCCFFVVGTSGGCPAFLQLRSC